MEEKLSLDIAEKLRKAKKTIRKIKLISKTALLHDKKERKNILESLVKQYKSEKIKSDIFSISKFNDSLSNFIEIFESQACESPKNTDNEENKSEFIKISGLSQDLPKDIPAEKLEPLQTKKKVKIDENAGDKRKWEDYKDKDNIDKGKFTDKEIEKLKNSLCQYVKVFSSNVIKNRKKI